MFHYPAAWYLSSWENFTWIAKSNSQASGWGKAPPQSLSSPISSTVGESTVSLCLSEELLFWALHRWSTGVTAPILYPHSLSHLEEVWGALAMCKTKQILHSVTDAFQTEPHCPWHDSFPQQKHMIGKHWGFHESFFCALAKYTDVITWKTQVLEFLPFL